MADHPQTPEEKRRRLSALRDFVYPLLAIGFIIILIAAHGGLVLLTDDTGLTWIKSELFMAAAFALVFGALRIEQPTGGIFGSKDDGNPTSI